MSYFPIKKVNDTSNPADSNSYLTIQGLINTFNLYASLATTYTKTQVDNLINSVRSYVDAAIKGNSQDVTSNITLAPGIRYYIIGSTANIYNLTLPSTFNKDDLFFIIGQGALYKIVQGPNQVIRSVQANTTVGPSGSLTSTNAYCVITLRGSVANTELTITSGLQGILTIT